MGDFWRNFAKGGMAVPLVQAVVLATHESFGAAWVNLRVVAKDGKPALGGEYPLSLRMVADRPIEGRLLDDQGKPIAGAVVRVEQLYAVPSGDLSPIIDALRKFDLKPYQSLLPADLAQQSRSPDGDSPRDHRRRRPVHAQGRRSRPPGQPRRDRPADVLDALDRPQPRRRHRGDQGDPPALAARAQARRPDSGQGRARPLTPAFRSTAQRSTSRSTRRAPLRASCATRSTGRPVQEAVVYIRSAALSGRHDR